MPKRVWNEEKIEKLKDMYGKIDNYKLSEILNVKKDTLLTKASELKLSYWGNRHVDWNDENISILRRHYPKREYEEIFKKITNATMHSIEGAAKKFVEEETDRYWKDSEIQLLMEKYPHYPNQLLADKFFPKRSKVSVYGMAKKLGIEKTEEKGRKFFHSENMLKDLREFGKELGRTPLILEVNENKNIPSETSYRRYFGSYKKACLLAGLKPNRTHFGTPVDVLVDKAGHICDSYAEVFIGDFFFDNNIYAEKSLMYAKVFDNDMFGKMILDWYLPKNGNIVVEYFGMLGNKEYENKMRKKIRVCRENSVELIEIYPENLNLKYLNNLIKKI